MKASETEQRPIEWRAVSAFAVLMLGVAMVGLSLVWTKFATSRSAWSNEQALEFQAASTKLHSLSHEHAHKIRGGNADAMRPELDKAQARFADLNEQLESARNRPARIATMLRFIGLLFAVAGGAIYLTGGRV